MRKELKNIISIVDAKLVLYSINLDIKLLKMEYKYCNIPYNEYRDRLWTLKTVNNDLKKFYKYCNYII